MIKELSKIKKLKKFNLIAATIVMGVGLVALLSSFSEGGEAVCLNIHPIESGKEQSSNGKCMVDVEGPDTFEGWTKTCPPGSNSCNPTTCDKKPTGCYVN